MNLETSRWSPSATTLHPPRRVVNVIGASSVPSAESHIESHQERQFFRALREIHRRAGQPSSRVIATKIGGMSHTTVILALRGPKVPTWPVVSKIVEALDGDVEAIRPLWMEAREPFGIVSPPDETEVRVFVSYARIDDQATYGRISKLIEDVANTYQSMTGKTVGVFMDVDSIRPGENWRDRIKLGLSYSSIFLAFISPAYLRSTGCREELSEFLAFLTSSSVERLVIPLIYAKKDRIDKAFTGDGLWDKITDREYEDIAELRSVNPGSSQWIETVEKLTDRIEEILSSFAGAESPDAATHGVPASRKSSDASLGTLSLGTLERMAAIEDKVPDVIGDMGHIGDLIESLNEQITRATPRFSKAQTFKERLAISRSVAKKLDPIADDMLSTADRLVTNFADWDLFVQTLLTYAQRSGDLADPDFLTTIGALWALSKTGGTQLAPIREFAQAVTQAMGVSRDLDRPLTAIQSSAMRVADMIGILDGWKEGLEILEVEYLKPGFLDNLLSGSSQSA